MATIAVLIHDGFEDSEYVKPAEAFKDQGHEIICLGLEEGAVVKGKKEGTEVTISRSVAAANPEEYDALLIPGGYAPDKLRAHAEPVDFVEKFFATGKPIFSICHGPQLLISAQVLKGKTCTGYRSIAQDIKNAGAHFVDQEVVVDGNLITSRQPSDIPAFNEACLKALS